MGIRPPARPLLCLRPAAPPSHQLKEKQAKTKVWEGHRKIRERLEKDGLIVELGKWRIDEPEYLS